MGFMDFEPAPLSPPRIKRGWICGKCQRKFLREKKPKCPVHGHLPVRRHA